MISLGFQLSSDLLLYDPIGYEIVELPSPLDFIMDGFVVPEGHKFGSEIMGSIGLLPGKAAGEGRVGGEDRGIQLEGTHLLIK